MVVHGECLQVSGEADAGAGLLCDDLRAAALSLGEVDDHLLLLGAHVLVVEGEELPAEGLWVAEGFLALGPAHLILAGDEAADDCQEVVDGARWVLEALDLAHLLLVEGVEDAHGLVVGLLLVEGEGLHVV